MHTRHYFGSILLAMLLATVFAAPQQSFAQGAFDASPTAKLVLKTYVVSDLVVVVPDYPYPAHRNPSAGYFGGMGGAMPGMGGGMGGRGGFFSVQTGVPGSEGLIGPGPGMGPGIGLGRPNHSPYIDMDTLIDTITSLCSPSSWDEVGGPGAIQPVGHTIAVLQASEVHQQIEDLFEQLRKGSGKRTTITIDARWLLLDSNDLESLGAQNPQGKMQVNRETLAQYTRRPASIRGLITCFSGQLVYLVSGTRQNIITSVIPVVGSAGKPEEFGAQFAQQGRLPATATLVSQPQGGLGGLPMMQAQASNDVGYQPVVEETNFGALLEIRPTLVPQEGTAVVDLTSTITVPGHGPANVITPPQETLGIPQVDRVAVETQQLATTLSIPLNEPVLVGGLTYVTPSTLGLKTSETPTAAQELAQETPQLYLILELRPGAESGSKVEK